jgi:protein involved in polysaccharide export with SLBB domain
MSVVTVEWPSVDETRSRRGAAPSGSRARGLGQTLRRACVAIALAATPAGCLVAQEAPADTPSVLHSGETASSLHPGDAIRVRVWREPDMTGEFRVDEMGMVVLPKIGPTRVLDVPAEQLRAQLTKTYTSYLTHTAVEVVFLRRIQVLGAVRTPGLYLTDPTMTLGDAIALAGGITSAGNPKRVELTRNGRPIGGSLSPGDRIGDLAIRSGDQLFVPEKSWASRNPNLLISLALTATSLAITILRYR